MFAADLTNADFYVASDGNDDGAGSREQPFRTLDRARDAVRALKAQSPDRPLTVLIRGGTYRLDQSVVFSGRDSGSAKAPITYKAYPSETPVFSGGRVVTGWKPYRDQVLAAQLPQIENWYYRFREMFLNGQRQIRARYPNATEPNPFLYAKGGGMDHALGELELVKASWGTEPDA